MNKIRFIVHFRFTETYSSELYFFESIRPGEYYDFYRFHFYDDIKDVLVDEDYIIYGDESISCTYRRKTICSNFLYSIKERTHKRA